MQSHPSEEHPRNIRKTHALRRAMKESGTLGWFVIFILVFCCMSGRDIFFSVAIGGLVENALTGDLLSLQSYLGLLAIAAGVSVPLQIFVAYADGRFGLYAIRNLYRRMFPSFARIPEAVYEKGNTGTYQSRMTNDVNQVQNFFSGDLPYIVWTCAYGLVPLVYLVYLNPFLALISYGAVPLLYWVIHKLMEPLSKMTNAASAAQAEALSIAQETIQQIESVKSYGLDTFMQQRYEEAQKKALFHMRQKKIREALSNGVNQAAYQLPNLIMLLVGVWQMIQGRLTISGLVVFMQLGGEGQYLVSALSEMIGLIRTANGHLERIYESVDTPHERIGGILPVEDAEPIIAFKEVDFQYEEREPTFCGLDFSVRRGETVALVGESGCGKSTVFKLMEGFYAPDAGSVTLWGQDTQVADLQALRDRLAIVPQDPFFMTGTLRDNLVFGDTHHTDAALLSALATAGLGDISRIWPDGLDMEIVEKGTNLSGGQKQRIAIARAILRDAPVLLFDEVTSALDYETERAVYQSIQALSKERTLLIISHRLSIVRNADRILVLDKGKITEQGNHEELMAQNGLYASLNRAEQEGGRAYA